MQTRIVAVACLLTLVLLNSQWAHSAPSGLNVIPTADVLDKGVTSLEIESAGNGRPFGDECDSFSLVQIGVGSGIELGVDRCLDDPDTWLNIKWRVRDESDRLPSLAFGIQGIGENGLAQPYIAALKSVGDTRVHTGLIVIDRKTRWTFGLDRPVGSHVTFQADYTSGDENSITYGIAASLSNSLSLTLAKSVGNAGETGNGHIINLAWSTSIK
ncbi:MAG: hypothetical protein ACYC0V_01815 [Armatimonadota bacterium]